MDSKSPKQRKSKKGRDYTIAAEIHDHVAPTNKLKYSNGWKEEGLFPNGNSFDKNIVGKVIRVLLPIEANGGIIEYSFFFRINWEFSHKEYKALL